MTTISAFNKLLSDFVDDLSDTFEDVPQMRLFKASLPVVLQTNERGGLDMFMKSTRPYGEKILMMDRTLFDEPVLIGGLDVSQLWHVEGLDEVSKTAIMNYVNTLFTLGIALETVDAPVLAGIEDLAKSAAAQMKDSGSIDFQSMLPGLMQNVGALLGADMSSMPDVSDPKLQSILDGVMSNFMGTSFSNLTAGSHADGDEGDGVEEHDDMDVE